MIGIFDSGVGALSVVKQISKKLPKSQIIYFGDTARLPYGTKGANFVKKYSDFITAWLIDHGAKVIVIGCHTSSAWASDYLKEKYKDIPIFDMISPSISDILATGKRIGIIGTPGTISSGSWEKRLLEANSSLKVYSKACPLFVPLVEEGWVDSNITKMVIKEYLSEFNNIDTLVLACTHYPMLRKSIQEVAGDIKIIDPAESLAKELDNFLKSNPQIKIKEGSDHQYFFSDEPYNLSKISKLCLNKEIEAEIIDPFQ